MSEHEYKVGDKVEVVGGPSTYDGLVGVVTTTDDNDMWPIRVEGRGLPKAGSCFSADELQLGGSATPDEPDLVKSPLHYSAGTPDGIEVIDILRAHEAAGGTWETMNALKYILRFPFKGNAAQDLAKAEQYLSMWKERESA